MSAIEDIWDAPVDPSSPRPLTTPITIDDDTTDDNEAPRPSKRPRRSSQPLFLADSDDDQPQPTANHTSAHPDIDAMFQDIDDDDDPDLAFQPLAPALDLDALRRQASAKHARSNPLGIKLPTLTPHAITSSSPPRDVDDDGKGTGKGKGKDDASGKDGERKERKKIARMDETRLVGPAGFPALISTTKGFVPKGKGHEATDLNRLLQVYQFWTHKMYPKTQFKDTVDRVEKLCHSKRMHVSLSAWRDEAKGLINGIKLEHPASDSDNDDKQPGVIDLTSDIETDSSPNRAKHKQKPLNSSPRAANERSVDVDLDLMDAGADAPPSSSTELDDDEFDIDALMREEEERLEKMREASSAAAPKTTYKPGADHDEEAMWDELNGMGMAGNSLSPPPPPVVQVPPDEDEDMWDVVREMDAGVDAAQESYVQFLPSPPQSEHTNPTPEPQPELPPTTDGGEGGDSTTGPGANEAREGTANETRPTNDEDWDDMYL